MLDVAYPSAAPARLATTAMVTTTGTSSTRYVVNATRTHARVTRVNKNALTAVRFPRGRLIFITTTVTAYEGDPHARKRAERRVHVVRVSRYQHGIRV